MQTRRIILFILLFFPLRIFGQDSIPALHTEAVTDTLFHQDSIKSNKNNIAAPGDTSAQHNVSKFAPVTSAIDTTQRINFWTVTPQTGEIIPAIPDTILTDYFNRTNPEGNGISVAYLGNLGLPMESRVFFEREDRSEFMFFDPFWAYSKRPDKFMFINTKVPYTNVSYQTSGSRQNKEERLQALFALNFGRKLNVGFSVDYLYARGIYASQAAKHTDWILFSNYLSDRHQLHIFINPSFYTNAENGGLDSTMWITHPSLMYSRPMQPSEYDTRFNNTWNHNNGMQIFLNYRYNLGFEKDSTFIPVSSFIYTFDYTGRSHRFYSEDTTRLNAFYNNADFLNPQRANKLTDDSTSYYSIKNTFALSLREGFSDWVKFDLTGFITQEIRHYTLMDTVAHWNWHPTLINPVPLNPQDLYPTFGSWEIDQNSTYIGGELSKQTGKILRYNAYAKFGVLGENIGDLDLSGNIETRIPLLKDTASVMVYGFFKNLEPTFYEKQYISRYFEWDNQFSKVRKVRFGGELNFPQTKTKLDVGVENLTNYIYFDNNGYPQQAGENIQILAATLQQNIRLDALHWDNQVVYQKSSKQDIIPLPDLCVYSSMYIQFKVAKVLTIQMGVNAHYWTEYYSPTYEPATQQFILQNAMKVGNYPLISGYFNCHLKQTRFFIQYYNLGAMFITPPNYFSMPYYPVDPPSIRMGLSVDWHN